MTSERSAWPSAAREATSSALQAASFAAERRASPNGAPRAAHSDVALGTIALGPHERTVPRLLQHQAECYGARPLLAIGGVRWRHADAAVVAARRGAALRAASIGRGDRVALMGSNRVETLEVFLACGWIGAVSVPINTAAMGPQIAYYLANSGARLLVIEDRFIERLASADLQGTRLEAIWIVGDAEGSDATAANATAIDGIDGVRCVPYPRLSGVGGNGGSDGNGANHIDSGNNGNNGDADTDTGDAVSAFAPAAVRPGDALAILYTSGTTGPAKGVVCPHAQYCAWGANTARILGVEADDVLATTLPLFHINALNTYAQAALIGCEVIFEARFSASGFWPAMQACRASVVYLLGAMVPILLAQPPSAAERAHRVRIGLGPGVPTAAAEAFEARSGVCLLEGYGSTETNFVIATAPDSPRRGVMGWLQPGFDACVADEHDVELPLGVAGELLLRADAPFAFASGYFGMPEQTVEAWRNLWFHTGDRVVHEADGAFRFVDRIKDAIRRRGENISSFEVEQALLGYPAVADAAVYPVRCELAEDEVMAALVARSGERIDPAEVVRFCESRLPYFAIPRYIDVLDELPRTENGKVQKYRLRERGLSATCWDGGARARPGRLGES